MTFFSPQRPGEVWKGGWDWHPLTGGGCCLWPRAPGGGSWGCLGSCFFSWYTPWKLTNWIPKMDGLKNVLHLLLTIWPFWVSMLNFWGVLLSYFHFFLEWRDVLDNVNVGINHPYINWIVRYGISISSIESANYQSLHQSSSNLLNSNLGVSTTLNWNQSKFDISWSNATSLFCHVSALEIGWPYFCKGFLDPPAGGLVVGGWVGGTSATTPGGPVEAGTYAAEGGARTGPPWSTEESGEGAMLDILPGKFFPAKARWK